VSRPRVINIAFSESPHFNQFWSDWGNRRIYHVSPVSSPLSCPVFHRPPPKHRLDQGRSNRLVSPVSPSNPPTRCPVCVFFFLFGTTPANLQKTTGLACQPGSPSHFRPPWPSAAQLGGLFPFIIHVRIPAPGNRSTGLPAAFHNVLELNRAGENLFPGCRTHSRVPRDLKSP